MRSRPDVTFASFRLDFLNERLWCEDKEIALRPKTFAVLRYLVERADRLVTKDELFAAVWPSTCVSDVVLAVCIREIRKALGDEAKQARFIQTVHGRGYRFIGRVASSQYLVVSRRSSQPAPNLVGRETELAQLHQWLATALAGRRQVVFITGEAGIGKTTLVEAFRLRLGDEPSLLVSHGQCIAHYGAGEPYLPIFDVLGRLCRGPQGTAVVSLLRRYAPTWLIQMPWLLSSEEIADVQRRVLGATQTRMLREMAEALEALAAGHGLVLILDDLHWADHATLDLLSFLARRHDPARLLLIGAYRPVEVLNNSHPLHTLPQELSLHGDCREMALSLLREADVIQYLERRFANSEPPALQQLARVVHRRTDGNPLFIVTLINDWVTRGVLQEEQPVPSVFLNAPQSRESTTTDDVPTTIQQMIEKQVEHLSPEEQQILEAASVVGVGFAAAAVSATLEIETEAIEAACTRLARRGQFLSGSGVAQWPDGTRSAQYHFLHALHQEALYSRIPTQRQVRLHRLIAERAEKAYGDRASEIAAELAVHFERGREFQRAIHYHRQAAKKAIQRCANREALVHVQSALALLRTFPNTADRAQEEFSICRLAYHPVIALHGDGSSERETLLQYMGDLNRQIQNPVYELALQHSSWGLHFVRGEISRAYELGAHLLELSHDDSQSKFRVSSHSALGLTLTLAGELVRAGEHLEQAVHLYDPQEHPSFSGMFDPRVVCQAYKHLGLCLLGHPDQALRNFTDALLLAQNLQHPYATVIALGASGFLHELRREYERVRQEARTLLAIATDHGFAQYVVLGHLHLGLSLARERPEECILRVRQHLASYRATGVYTWQTFLLAQFAEVLTSLGRSEEGISLVSEGLTIVSQTGERIYEAELYRLKGELLLTQESKSQKSKGKGQKETPNTQHQEAEACFHKAIATARRQQAKLLELRAATSLSRLWLQQGKKDNARRLLSDVYIWFTEGFALADLREAKVLLELMG